MTFDNIGTHAPTGFSNTVVSSNPYDTTFGRNTPYPNRFSVYIRKIAEPDGSQSVVENRTTSQIIGNRLYLWHRPLQNSSGTPTTITVAGGGSPAIDTASTNAKQGYIVFSTLPTSDFTVSYTAAPDCVSTWHLNTLQDDVMEIQKVLGPSNLTGYPGLRNLSFGIFDNPSDANLSGVAQRAIYLSHLNQNIVIGSTNDPTLTASLGTQHQIQIGRATDAAHFDVTGFSIGQSDATKTSRIYLGNRTGDILNYAGQISGEGPVTIGGPTWPGYSGTVFTAGLSGGYYSGSMLRVNGNVSVIGEIRSIGPLTVYTATGEASVVLGDWVVRDELFVYGETHLQGVTDTNRLDVNNHIHLDGNLLANNQIGNGGNGQTLIDNLDCSEIAHNYKTVTKRRLPYSVIDGPFSTEQQAPKLTLFSPHYALTNTGLVGEIFSITGLVNAPAGPSGAHPNIIQLNLNTQIVTGTYNTTGSYYGVWAPTIMDPGSMWIYTKHGTSAGFNSPIYGYTIESGNPYSLVKLNVFCPELVEPRPTTNDQILLYNPHNVLYNFVKAAGGASPTFLISGSSSFPVKISFDDEVRILTAQTSNISLVNSLTSSVSGQGGTVQTGISYIFASMSGTDPENPPLFKTRPVSMRMPWETVVGEVTASLAGGTWTILESISYRPGGVYDSCWIPVVSSSTLGNHSGRFIPVLSTSTAPVKMYFQHYLGPDLDLSMTNIDIYLGKKSTNTLTGFNQTHTDLNSFHGGDTKAGFGNGSFLRVPLHCIRDGDDSTARDASIFYMDGKVIGIQMTPELLDAVPTGLGSGAGNTFDHLRLVIRRDI